MCAVALYSTAAHLIRSRQLNAHNNLANLVKALDQTLRSRLNLPRPG